MIDIENQIFDYLSRNLKEKFPKINVTSEFISDTPASFPVVLIYELDNYVYSPTIDSSFYEQDVRVSYQIDIYTKSKTTSKASAKKILHEIDYLLGNYGIIRTIKTQLDTGFPDMAHIVARYQAIINRNGLISN